MENIDIIDTLNPLIETSRDGDNGFTACADDSENPSLKSYFTICATRCRESVRVLEDLVLRHGGSPETSGTLSATVHRAWLNLRGALSSHDDLAVLEECERAEDVALQAYRSALEKNLPAEIRTVVELQYEGVKDNHDRVRGLRDDKKRLAA